MWVVKTHRIGKPINHLVFHETGRRGIFHASREVYLEDVGTGTGGHAVDLTLESQRAGAKHIPFIARAGPGGGISPPGQEANRRLTDKQARATLVMAKVDGEPAVVNPATLQLGGKSGD